MSAMVACEDDKPEGGVINNERQHDTALDLKKEGAEDEDEDDDDEEEDGIKGVDGNEADGSNTNASKKKKKKKKKTKKKSSNNNVATSSSAAVPSKPQHMRLLTGFTDYYVGLGQTDPPSIIVSDLFPSGNFPEGEMQPHGKTKYPDPLSSYTRMSEEEKREKDRLLHADLYEKVRQASEVHRQVRHYSQSFIKPGIRLIDMCEQLEECNRRLVKENGLQAGIGFPTGCSLNHVAAHYTPNSGDETVLQYGDVMKIDFGTQIDGTI